MSALGYLESQAGAVQRLNVMGRARLIRTITSLLLIVPGLIGLSRTAQTAEISASTFRDCADCPEMVVIPAGEFVMGVSPGEEDREALSAEFRNRSAPQRRIRVGDFSAGRYEVTRAQYRKFIEATGHRGEGCFVWSSGDFRMDAGKSWQNPGHAQDDRHPVNCVSWEDALAYTKWLSAITGRYYRLLTEAEWEYAARGGNPASRFWGDDINLSCDFSNGADRRTLSLVAEAGDWPSVKCDDRHAHTAPVGSYRANAYGLHDMLGNVAEWTADCWNGDYRDAPADARARMTGNCFMRAVRGGAWDEGPASLRSAYRVGSPVVIRVYSRGFRVARDH